MSCGIATPIVPVNFHKVILGSLILGAGLLYPAKSFAQSATLPMDFTVEGRLYDSNGDPLNASAVDVQLELLVESSGTASDCVIYRETHSAVNVSSADTSSAGVFALRLGSGARDFPASAPQFTTLFSPGTFNGDTNNANTVNCSQVAASGDHRFVRVKLHTASITGYETLSPDTRISAVPQALVAETAKTLDGYGTASLLMVNSGGSQVLSQSNLETVFSTPNYTQLLNLISGTSAIAFGGRLLSGISTPVASTDAVNKIYSDTKVAGSAVDVTGVGPSVGDGKTLLWDAAAAKWTTGTPIAVDSTKLPLAGGTMAGAITMNGFDLYATGHITMSPLKSLTFGTLSTAQETTLVSGLTAANKGATWYNTTLSSLRVWNGTAVSTQAYLDGGSKITASWLPDTSVVSGTYGTTPGKVPVFTVGSDGRLTAASEVSLPGGLPPVGAAGGDLTGTYPNPTLANDAVTTSKIADLTVTSAKLSSTGPVNGGRILTTDSVNPNDIHFFECAMDEIAKWTPSGWACSTVASLSPVSSVAGKIGAVTLNSGDISGLGTAALLDSGTAANQILQLSASSKIPAVDGSLLTSVNAVKLQMRAVSSLTPASGQVLTYNGGSSTWEPTTPALGGSVTQITSGQGLLGGPITTSGTLHVDVGTSANQIVQLNGSAQVAMPSGSATVPTYTFGSSPSTGLYSPAANTLGIAIGGSAGLFIDPSRNVGIGTTAPDAPLTVNGVIHSSLGGIKFPDGSLQTTASGGGANGDFKADGSIPMTGQLQAIAGSASVPSFAFANEPTTGITSGSTFATSNSINFVASSSLLARLSNLGLALNSGTASAPAIYNFLSGNTGLYWPSSQSLGVSTGGQERMRIDASGNVGIGTTAPNSLLHITDASTATRTNPEVSILQPNLATLNSTSLLLGKSATDASYLTYNYGATPATRYSRLGVLPSNQALSITESGQMSFGSSLPVNGAVFDLSSTPPLNSSMVLPQGSTASRPASPVAGMLRYNTTTSHVEGYDSGAWKDMITLPSGGTGALQFAQSGGFNSNSSLIWDNPNLRLGVNSATPRATLDVGGSITPAPATANASTTINYALGNTQYTTSSCQAFVLNNLKDGGSYSFVVKGTSAAVCSFTAYSDNGSTALTMHLPPDHASTIGGSHTFYTFTVVGNDVYTAWTPGY